MIQSPPRYFKKVNEDPEDEIFESFFGVNMSHNRNSDLILNEGYSVFESLREMTEQDEINEVESIENSLEAIQNFLNRNPNITKSIIVSLSLYLKKLFSYLKIFLFN